MQKHKFEEIVEELFEYSVKQGIYLSAGSLPSFTDGNIYNSSFLFDGVNRKKYTYQKKNLFGNERDVFSEGNKPFRIKIENFNVSTLVCYDLRFPEMFRFEENIASDLFIVQAAWPSARIEQWRSLLIARAIENQAFVVGCNGVGVQGKTTLGGNSVAVSPKGEVIIELKQETGFTVFEFKLGEVTNFRNEIPAMYDLLRSHS